MRNRTITEFEYEFEWVEEEMDEAGDYQDVDKTCLLGIEVDTDGDFTIVFTDGDKIPNDWKRELDNELDMYFEKMVWSDEELFMSFN